MCKSHKHAYIILTETVAKLEHTQAALAAVAPDFEKVVIACQKIIHVPHRHVKLGLSTTKSGNSVYRLQVSAKSLTEFLNPKTPASKPSARGRKANHPPDHPSLGL